MFVIVKVCNFDVDASRFVVRMSPDKVTISDDLNDAFLFPSYDTALLFLYVQHWFDPFEFSIFPYQLFVD